MDYEFEAFRKGFNEGMTTIWATFDIKDEDIKKKLSFDLINAKISILYQIWQKTLLNEKISREDDILNKKIIQKTNKLKNAIVNYIESYRTL